MLGYVAQIAIAIAIPRHLEWPKRTPRPEFWPRAVPRPGLLFVARVGPFVVCSPGGYDLGLG